MPMRLTLPILGSLCLGLAAAVALRAQTVSSSSAPLGGSTQLLVPNVPSNDYLLTAPFQRPAAYLGSVGVVSGNQVTAAGSPAWTAGQWTYAAGSQPNTYALRFTSGAKAGHSYTITASTATALTLELLNHDLGGVAPGDRFKLVPYWTLGTLFPAANAGTAFTVTTGPSTYGTTLALTDPHSPGLNLEPVNFFFFFNNAWRSSTTGPGVDQSDVIVPCDLPFRLSHPSGLRTVGFAGVVETGPQVIILATSGTAAVDNPIGTFWPLAVTLDNSGLAGTAVTESPGVGQRTDMLMVYSNAGGIPNRAADFHYFRYNGAWRSLGGSLTVDVGATKIFGPNLTVVVRKGPVGTAAPVTWVTPTH